VKQKVNESNLERDFARAHVPADAGKIGVVGGMPRKRRGTPPKISSNNFQPIRPDEAWHPKCGAPFRNRNAQTHGARAREMQAMRKYARELIRESRAAIAAFYAGEERRLAEPPPAP
jgi:hypothetical protein